MLVFIKVLHTLIWAFMVVCIAGIYVFASRGDFVWAFAAIGIVFFETAVLALNRMTCPLSSLATRYTKDRRPSFDIYLPEWLARHNQPIFGGLYFAGINYTLVLWQRAS